MNRVAPPAPRQVTWRAPGRVNLIGDHTDYNDGYALPFAIAAGVTATVATRPDDILQIASAQQASVTTLAMSDLAPGTVTGWAAYAAAVVWALTQTAGHRCGLQIHVDGDVPLGAGLSSSAALTCSVAAAVNDLWQLKLSTAELVAITRRAENDFVGAPTGGLDQMASLMCRRDHALFLDFRSGTHTQIPLDLEAAGLTIVITDTKQAHNHADGQYADRRAACTEAAQRLGVHSLRDIDPPALAAAERQLSDPVLAAAARHVVTENARVLTTVELLRADRIDAIGPLLDASHHSLQHDFAVTTAPLNAAVHAAKNAGAIGARMTGGGFGGCTIALARTGDAAAIQDAIARAYAHNRYAPPHSWTVQPTAGAAPAKR